MHVSGSILEMMAVSRVMSRHMSRHMLGVPIYEQAAAVCMSYTCGQSWSRLSNDLIDRELIELKADWTIGGLNI